MIRNTVFALLLFFGLLFSNSSVVSAHGKLDSLLPAPLPASMFPDGAKVTLYAHMGNKGWTCLWASDCSTGQPIFHSGPSSSFNRIDGWAETIALNTKIQINGKPRHDIQFFAYVVSRFKGSGGYKAFKDFSTRAEDAPIPDASSGITLTKNGQDQTYLMSQTKHNTVVVASMAPSNDTDVEAILNLHNATSEEIKADLEANLEILKRLGGADSG